MAIACAFRNSVRWTATTCARVTGLSPLEHSRKRCFVRGNSNQTFLSPSPSDLLTSKLRHRTAVRISTTLSLNIALTLLPTNLAMKTMKTMKTTMKSGTKSWTKTATMMRKKATTTTKKGRTSLNFFLVLSPVPRSSVVWLSVSSSSPYTTSTGRQKNIFKSSNTALNLKTLKYWAIASSCSPSIKLLSLRCATCAV